MYMLLLNLLLLHLHCDGNMLANKLLRKKHTKINYNNYLLLKMATTVFVFKYKSLMT